jgi:hypothetical protein
VTDPIDDLLSEAHLSGDARLRDYLSDLEKAATADRPVPSAELAALLRPAPRRSSIHHPRMVITTLIIAGALGAGVSAAAANPEIREEAGKVLGVIFGTTVPETERDPMPAVTIEPGSGGWSHDPTPLEATTSSHPTPTDHPDGTDHPGPDDHPGWSNSDHSDGNNGNSPSDTPPADRMPSVPADPPFGVGGPSPKP